MKSIGEVLELYNKNYIEDYIEDNILGYYELLHEAAKSNNIPYLLNLLLASELKEDSDNLFIHHIQSTLEELSYNNSQINSDSFTANLINFIKDNDLNTGYDSEDLDKIYDYAFKILNIKSFNTIVSNRDSIIEKIKDTNIDYIKSIDNEVNNKIKYKLSVEYKEFTQSVNKFIKNVNIIDPDIEKSFIDTSI
jgi:hypothetical protein